MRSWSDWIGAKKWKPYTPQRPSLGGLTTLVSPLPARQTMPALEPFGAMTYASPQFFGVSPRGSVIAPKRKPSFSDSPRIGKALCSLAMDERIGQGIG